MSKFYPLICILFCLTASAIGKDNEMKLRAGDWVVLALPNEKYYMVYRIKEFVEIRVVIPIGEEFMDADDFFDSTIPDGHGKIHLMCMKSKNVFVSKESAKRAILAEKILFQSDAVICAESKFRAVLATELIREDNYVHGEIRWWDEKNSNEQDK